MTLSEDEIEKLRRIIHWWDNRRGFDEDTSTIKFDRSNSKVASVRLGGKMYADAVALAENDPEVKNFNRLMELLLWEKLEKSEEYLVIAKN
jgi:hypothetical protein